MQLNRRSLLMGAGALALSACATGRRDPVAADIFDTSAENQIATFSNADQYGAARLIHRAAGRPSALPQSSAPLSAFGYEFEGGARTLDQYVADNRAAAVLIAKGGAVALERYESGVTRNTLWQGFSVAKPITSTLAGCALADGAIESLDDPAVRYARSLRGSAYAEVSVRNLLRLMSGVSWDEDLNTSSGAGIGAVNAAVRSGDRGALMRLMRAQPRAAEQGTVFNYNTGEAYVLGEVIAGATGKTLSDYLSEKFWQPMGAESDAYWLTCGDQGPEVCGYGVSATLRDYARFGLSVMNDGANGRRVLPEGWIALAGQPDNPVTANGAIDDGYPLGHGYMWWTMPTGDDALTHHDGAFTAQGLHGQILYINPKEDVVAVVFSAWREPWDTRREMETWAMLGGAIAQLDA